MPCCASYARIEDLLQMVVARITARTWYRPTGAILCRRTLTRTRLFETFSSGRSGFRDDLKSHMASHACEKGHAQMDVVGSRILVRIALSSSMSLGK